MKRHFHKFRDDRFALTTLQNPNLEVRTHAQLVQAAQPVAQPLLLALNASEGSVQAAAQISALRAPAPPDAPARFPPCNLFLTGTDLNSEIWQTNENERETIF